jgi:hypothetical protein
MSFWNKLFGNSDNEATGESEARLHDDARRFAQLLVAEIKLNNEVKVYDGLQNADLYKRLKTEIERSRKVYDKRVSPLVAAKVDYFHEELVKTLAGGDASKLGPEWRNQT